MKIKELLEKLKTMDQDLDLVVEECQCGGKGVVDVKNGFYKQVKHYNTLTNTLWGTDDIVKVQLSKDEDEDTWQKVCIIRFDGGTES